VEFIFLETVKLVLSKVGSILSLSNAYFVFIVAWFNLCTHMLILNKNLKCVADITSLSVLVMAWN